MDEINRRVMQLILHYNLSKSAFAQLIGVSAPVITHISSGRNKVGLDVVQKIVVAFPDLSSEWLLLGRGEMLKQEEMKFRQQYKTDLVDLDSQLKAVSQELSVAMHALDKVKKRF